MSDNHVKKVLLIAPRFFGYEADIKKSIEKHGLFVDWLQDRPYDKPWQLGLLRILPSLMLFFTRRYYSNQLRKIADKKYDAIFAVNTVTLSPEVLVKLRHLYPKASFILYMWDSMKNRAHVEDILSQFDIKWCFDPVTSERYSMKFQPLFYVDDYKPRSQDSTKYDLSFIGSVHADRYSVIKKIQKILPERFNTFFYLYLRARWQFWVFKLFNSSMRDANISEFGFSPMNKASVSQVLRNSMAVLDIEHPNQTGLTMRTFETLGSGKKLITTNAGIKNYDFYNSNNIAIVDRNNPHIEEDFWTQEYEPVPTEILNKYSIDAWVSRVFLSQVATRS